MSLQRRTERLEEQADAEAGEPVVFNVRYTLAAPGGGTFVEARTMTPPAKLQECPVRYFFEPAGEEERRELTKEEYEAALPDSHAPPEDAGR